MLLCKEINKKDNLSQHRSAPTAFDPILQSPFFDRVTASERVQASYKDCVQIDTTEIDLKSSELITHKSKRATGKSSDCIVERTDDACFSANGNSWLSRMGEKELTLRFHEDSPSK